MGMRICACTHLLKWVFYTNAALEHKIECIKEKLTPCEIDIEVFGPNVRIASSRMCSEGLRTFTTTWQTIFPLLQQTRPVEQLHSAQCRPLHRSPNELFFVTTSIVFFGHRRKTQQGRAPVCAFGQHNQSGCRRDVRVSLSSKLGTPWLSSASTSSRLWNQPLTSCLSIKRCDWSINSKKHRRWTHTYTQMYPVNKV